MQVTSKAYKTEQKGYLRNENYVFVYLGIVSKEAQKNAVAVGEFDLSSDETQLFGNPVFEAYYASNEENMARVNHTQYFMPRDKSLMALYQGLVTQRTLGEVYFYFGNYHHLNFKGLTIDFGDYYPTSFSITNGTSSGSYDYENDKPGKWTTEDEFLDTDFIKITVHSMVGGKQKLRIFSILFGLGFLFDNTHLISTSWKSEVAHLSDALPVKSFSFTIDNLSRKFSADNPHSYVAFLQEQQEVIFEYGRGMADGTIYHVPGGKLSLSSWSSNDQQAKFTAVGFLDYSLTTYNKGKFYPDGISLYDLAVDVCEDAGYEEYSIDPYLMKVITHNPLPVEKHKNLLQLIANSARAILRETRTGQVEIVTSFQPDIVTLTTNGHTDYSNLENLVDQDANFHEYASNERDFTYCDGHQYFLPRNAEEGYLATGYVSRAVSDEDGYFTVTSGDYIRFVHDDGEITEIAYDNDMFTNMLSFIAEDYTMPYNSDTTPHCPSIYIEWEAPWTFYNLTLLFADAYPKEFVIYTYRGGEEVSRINCTENIKIQTLIEHDFIKIDAMVIEFIRTNPKQRIHLGKIVFGDITDYTIEYMDMSATPTAARTDFIRDVNVVYSQYAYGTEEKSISTVHALEGENTAESKKAHHDYSLAYKEIKDDDTEHRKVSKKFVDDLPELEDAKSNTRYFVGDSPYQMYILDTSDNTRRWELVSTVTEQIVNTLPSSLSANKLYLVETDTDLIYHLYMKDDDEVISLGYDVRGTLEILDSSAYFITFSTNIEADVVISGIEFTVTERTYTNHLNEIGTDKTATNVLIDNEKHAISESEWLGEYFNNDVKYTIQYRGEPALDPDDAIYIENRFVEKNLVRLSDTQINTSTGMSMSCILHGRRLRYVEPDVTTLNYNAIVDVSEVM